MYCQNGDEGVFGSGPMYMSELLHSPLGAFCFWMCDFSQTCVNHYAPVVQFHSIPGVDFRILVISVASDALQTDISHTITGCLPGEK